MVYAGSAIVIGNLKIKLGNNVCIFDNIWFAGLKIFDDPQLIVGSDTYLSFHINFLIGKPVTIGNNCLVVSKMITDNPGHPMDDVMSRLQSGEGSPSPNSIRPITILDFCFLPVETVVYPGVTIGDGVLARDGTHINKDVPSFCQIAGNPMRIVRKLPVPEEIQGIFGKDRYENYINVHNNIVV